MYPRNAASPERVGIGAVVQISDGAVQTSGVTITVRGQGGAEGTGGGTTAYGASGIVYYTPTQAETDFTSFVLIASKTGCIPVAQTIVTTATSTPGYVVAANLDVAVSTRLATAGYTAPDNASIATILTRTDVATSTRLASADYIAPDNAGIASLEISVAAIPADVLIAAAAEPISANIKKVNDLTVDGAGTEANPWGPA